LFESARGELERKGKEKKKYLQDVLRRAADNDEKLNKST
jgi:hypothetical protein